MVDEKQLEQDLNYIEIGRSEGAKLHWGGERLNRATPGFYLQPAFFTETTMPCALPRGDLRPRRLHHPREGL